MRSAPQWNPWQDLEQLRREVNRMFGDRVIPPLAALGGGPAVNLLHDRQNLVLTAEIPGIDPEQLDITLTRDTVTLRGKRALEPVPEGAEWSRRERPSGEFARTVDLPFEVDPQQAEADYHHGVLVLKLRRPEEHLPKKVVVKAG